MAYNSSTARLMSTNTRLIIVLALFGLTFISLQFVQSAKIVPIKRTLTEFPAEIGEWKRTDVIQSSDAVVEMLGLDDYINYTYTAPDGMSLNFYTDNFRNRREQWNGFMLLQKTRLAQ